MNILTFNVCRSSWDNVHEIICELSSLHSGVICLQEISAWPSDATEALEIRVWTLVHKLGSPAGLLLPAAYVDIRWTGAFLTSACAVLGNVGVIVVQLSFFEILLMFLCVSVSFGSCESCLFCVHRFWCL